MSLEIFLFKLVKQLVGYLDNFFYIHVIPDVLHVFHYNSKLAIQDDLFAWHDNGYGDIVDELQSLVSWKDALPYPHGVKKGEILGIE